MKAILFALIFTSHSYADPQRVVSQVKILGTTKLTHTESDVDVLTFKPCRNNVNAVKLRLRHGNAEIESVWVRFANGTSETLNIRSRIAKGGETRWVDLQGGERCVTSIGVIGDTENSKRRAKVEVCAR